MSAVSQLAGLLFTGTVVVVTLPEAPDAHVLGYGLAAGAVGAAGLACLYAGLAVGPMGVVAPIAALSGTVPVIAGYVQGERPATAQIAGIVLALAGVVLASRQPGVSGERVSAKGLWLALGAAVLLGTLIVLLDAAGESSPSWAVLLVRVGALMALSLAILVRRPSLSLGTNDLGRLAMVGVLDNGANLLFVYASQRGLLSLVAVVASLYPVTTIILARGSLGERLSRGQVFGVALAFAGVALIAAG